VGVEATTSNSAFLGPYAGRKATGSNNTYIAAHSTDPGAGWVATNDQIYIDGNTGDMSLGEPASTNKARARWEFDSADLAIFGGESLADYVAAHGGGGGTTLVITASATVAVNTNGATRTLSVPTGAIGATELASTAVAAGTYTGPYTVDADGRLTAATNFAQPATNAVTTLTPVGTTGTLTGASAYWQWRLTTNSTLTATMTDFPTNRSSAIALSVYYGTKSLTFTTGTVFSASSVALLATPSTTAWNLYSITKGYGATTLTIQGPIQ
jgi:hypothetical protein